MRFESTDLPDVMAVFLEPHRDPRGWFARAFDRTEFGRAGVHFEWIQANLAHNTSMGTLRGIHFQRAPYGEAKLVRCTRGSLYDVAVDLRPDSRSYLRWYGTTLSADEGKALLVPPGFGHGYLTLEPDTDLYYQSSVVYTPSHASGVRSDDPRIGVAWPIPISVISDPDRAWPLIDERDDL